MVPWLADADAALGGPETLPERVEVAVVGAGAAGAAVALYLARGGARVALLEARDRVGAAGGGRGPGVVFPGLTEPVHRTEYALGAERTRELVDLGRRSLALLREVVAVEAGGVWVALDDREGATLEQDLVAWTAAGVPATGWDADRVAEALGVRLGPGIHFPEDGRVDPHAAIVAIVAAARAAGAQVVTGAAVTGVEHTARGVQVRAAGRVLHAEVVVWCAGVALPDVEPFFHDKITPVREAALAAPVARGPGLGWRAQQGWLTWRGLPDGRTLIRGARWATPHLETGETAGVVAPAVRARLEGLARQRLGIHGPLGEPWAWIEAHTCDNLPIVGLLPGGVRFACCAGFGGNPLGMALGAAETVAEGLLTGRSTAAAFLSPSRFV